MRQKTILAVLFLVLFAVVAYKYFQFRSSPFEFQSRLLKVDTERVTAISVQWPQGEEMIFSKDPGGWLASDGRRGIWIPQKTADELLRSLEGFIAQEILDGKEIVFDQYGVGENEGTRVRVFSGSEIVEDFLLGKVNSGDQTSYLRFWGQNEVYKILEAAASPFRRPYGNYRDSSFLFLPFLGEVDSLQYQLHADSMVFSLIPAGERWELANYPGLFLDSVSWERHWSRMGQIAPEVYADDFDELTGSEMPDRRLVVWARGGEPLVLSCYWRSQHPYPFVLHSSRRPNDFFASDSAGIFRDIFENMDSIIYKAVRTRRYPGKGQDF